MVKILGFLVSENGEVKVVNATEENIQALFEEKINTDTNGGDSYLSETSTLLERTETAKRFLNDVEKQRLITEIINNAGIPANIKGYRYIKCALTKAIDDYEYIDTITKRLYPEIAREFSTTSSRVERAIRHAIESGWGSNMIGFLNDRFGTHISPVDKKLTNSQFLATIVEGVKNTYDF